MSTMDSKPTESHTEPFYTQPSTLTLKRGQSYRLKDVFGADLVLHQTADVEGNLKWWLQAPGVSERAVYPSAVSSYTFVDTDGVYYVYDYGRLAYSRLDPATYAAAGEVIDPDHTYKVASREQVELVEFVSTLDSLHVARDRLRHAEAQYAHPRRSSRFRKACDDLEKLEAEFQAVHDMSPEQMELALRLYASSMLHTRDLKDAVRTVG